MREIYDRISLFAFFAQIGQVPVQDLEVDLETNLKV